MYPRVRRLTAPFVSALCALTILLHADLAAAVIIDDFSVGAITVARNGAAAAIGEQTGLDPNHVLGGARSIVVGAFGSSSQTLAIDPSLSLLQFTNDSSGGGYFDLGYGSEKTPLNVDLTADGADSFLIEFGAYSTLHTLTVFTSTGSAGRGRFDATITPLPDGRVLARYPFSAFPATLDFTSVEQIELSFFRLSPSNVPTLLNFTTVPEPSGISLIALGAFALYRRNRAYADRGALLRPRARPM